MSLWGSWEKDKKKQTFVPGYRDKKKKRIQSDSGGVDTSFTDVVIDDDEDCSCNDPSDCDCGNN